MAVLITRRSSFGVREQGFALVGGASGDDGVRRREPDAPTGEDRSLRGRWMKAACIAVLTIALVCDRFGARAHAQTPDSARTLGEVVQSDLSAIGADALRIAAAPLHFNAQDWAVTAAVVGGTAVLFSLDRTARQSAHESISPSADRVFNLGREYGREIYALSLSGGLYAGGLLLKSNDLRTTGRMLFESVAIAGVLNMALKSLIGRSRPQTDEGPFRFRGFQSSLEHTSLPSGHTTVAFSVSSILASRLRNRYASIGLYALASVTAGSRVYHDNHWLSDTFLGAALGTAVGLAVARTDEASPDLGLLVEPSVSGLRVVYVF